MKKFSILFTLVALTAVVATGCGNNERQAFIDATVESTCLFFETEDIFDESLSGQVQDVFEKYGFDTSEESLENLKNKYAEDTEVQSAILEGISQCGGDFTEGLDVELPEEDPMMDELDEMIEEAAASEEEAEMEEGEQEGEEVEEEVTE